MTPLLVTAVPLSSVRALPAEYLDLNCLLVTVFMAPACRRRSSRRASVPTGPYRQCAVRNRCAVFQDQRGRRRGWSEGVSIRIVPGPGDGDAIQRRAGGGFDVDRAGIVQRSAVNRGALKRQRLAALDRELTIVELRVADRARTGDVDGAGDNGTFGRCRRVETSDSAAGDVGVIQVSVPVPSTVMVRLPLLTEVPYRAAARQGPEPRWCRHW